MPRRGQRGFAIFPPVPPPSAPLGDHSQACAPGGGHMPARRRPEVLGRQASSQRPAGCVSGGVAAPRVASQTKIPYFFCGAGARRRALCSITRKKTINNPGHVNNRAWSKWARLDKRVSASRFLAALQTAPVPFLFLQTHLGAFLKSSSVAAS